MRYRFIDRVVSLDGTARRIEVAKTFTRAGDELSGPAGPDRVPNSLVIELLAMTGGRLLFECLDAARLPLLAKIREVRFLAPARPGLELMATSEVVGLVDIAPGVTSAETTGTVSAHGELLARGTLFYVCVAPEGVDLRAMAQPA